jgi:hypothetical protein
MCNLDTKGEGNFGKLKLCEDKNKNLVLSQWEFRVPRRGQSVHED